MAIKNKKPMEKSKRKENMETAKELISTMIQNEDKSFAEFFNSGHVDVDLLLHKFRESLKEQYEQKQLCWAIDKCLESSDNYMPMPELIARTLNEMKVKPEEIRQAYANINEYIRENSTEKVDQGKLFHIKKGYKGGIRKMQAVKQ
jgi:hypothetical protein